ncbi:MAG: Rossmann-like domain-containing protein [Promethearchaeota archaeon]|jgi:uncharacterized protein (DUF4213/DUF364 family)
MILEETIELIRQIYKDYKIIPPKVTKVVLGLGYTGVEVSAYAYEPFLGLASTLPSVVNITDCSKIEFAGNLTKKTLSELLNWSLEAPSIKKIIGVATLNGVSQHIFKIKNPYSELKEDLLRYLMIDKKTQVTIIGLMKPLIRKLTKYTNLITIVEDLISLPPEYNKFNFRNSIEQLKSEELSIDILFCTGTALINNSIDKILELFKNKAQRIILIGPSASLIPDILFDNGVDIVGGMEISNTEATLQVLQEGGGTKLFKQYGKKYNLIKV